MADRYHERTYATADTMDRDYRPSAKVESDPLAELARLIGQADPNADFGQERPAAPMRPSRRQPSSPAESDYAADDNSSAGPPPWMRRHAEPPPAEPAVPRDVHPLRRYAAAHHLPEPTYHTSPQVQPDADHASRYDDALYGPADADAEHAAYGSQQHAGYHDDYSYQDDYAEDEEERKPRRKGLATVAAVVALAVVGTGAAFAYRTFVGTTRSGEPPIIKADAGPNKVVPPSADNAGKQIQDRMAAGNGAEKLVSREEQPVDVKDIAKSGPRVVFPPLNQNANPPSTASVAPGNRLAANGGSAAAVGGTEPRKIKTLMVRSDEATATAAEPVTQRAPAPAPVPAPPATTRAAFPQSAPSANAPLSLAPQAAPGRVASVNPTQTEAPAATGGYVVQVSSQRSEADARASFKALQQKFPSSFGSRAPLIKRADLGSRGVYYRAMVGPFGTSEQAVQFCGNLKASGGQCVVQRN